MKLEIKKDLLVNGLTKVEKAVSKNSNVPILQGILFEVTEDHIRFVGTNDEQTIEVKFPVDENITIERTGSLVFNKGITEIAKKLPNGTVKINSSDDLRFTISSGKSNFTLSGYDAEEYPKFTQPDGEAILEFTFDELKDVVNKLHFCASVDDKRPILQGIHISTVEKYLKFVSTNSHILSQKMIAKEVNEEISLIPKAKSLVDTLRVFDTNDTIKVFATNTHLILQSQSGTITVRNRLLEGNYPETDRLLVTDFKAIIEVEKKDFLNALEQVYIMCQSGSGNSPSAATISVIGENIKIENSFTEIGKAEIEVPIKELQMNESDLEVKFSFNVPYMINLTKATDGNIKLGFISDMRPIAVLGTESNGEYKLILPVRTR
jgi:DNA polymerase III subunit beta